MRQNTPITSRTSVRVWSAVVLLLVLSLFLAVGPGNATVRLSGANVIVPADRTTDDDLMLAGSNLMVQGPVNGDVLAAGSNVVLNSTVQHDALLAGANVTVNGPVQNNLRAMGANVTVSAPVGRSASFAGSTVTLEPSAHVGRDVDLAGGTVKVLGPVGRNLALAAGDAEIGGEVQGSVSAQVRRLSLRPGAIVHGDLVVNSPQAPEISPQAQVLGQVIHHPTPAAAKPRPGAWVSGWIFGWLLHFLWMLVAGAAMIAISPLLMEQIADTITKQPGPTALTGCLSVLLIPILGFILLFTLIGIPIAVILFALYLSAVALAGAFVAYRVGMWLTRRTGRPEVSPYARLALGAIIVAFFTSLPWIGGLIQFIVFVAGFGAMLVERWDLMRRLRAEGIA